MTCVSNECFAQKYSSFVLHSLPTDAFEIACQWDISHAGKLFRGRCTRVTLSRLENYVYRMLLFRYLYRIYSGIISAHLIFILYRRHTRKCPLAVYYSAMQNFVTFLKERFYLVPSRNTSWVSLLRTIPGSIFPFLLTRTSPSDMTFCK